MPIPKAALAAPRQFPSHDIVDEPLTARLDTAKKDSVYGEQTATSRRPMETYEKWLAENRERTTSGGADDDDLSMDEIKTESLEAPVPRKEAAPKTMRMPERAGIVAKPRTDVSVNVSIEEVDDTDGLFSDEYESLKETRADDNGSDPIVESRVDSVDEDEDQSFPDTRNGMPKVPSAYASQPLPLVQSSREIPNPPARIATALGLGPSGFAPVAHPAPVQQEAQQSAVQSISQMSVPSGSQIPLQSAQLQALRMQAMQQLQMQQMQAAHAQQMQQMQAAHMQVQQQLQQRVVAAPHAPGAPAVPQAQTKSESRVVHRAPWFCLGLMFGVAAMVAAFFMPGSRESAVADAAKQTQVVQVPQGPQPPPPQQYAPPPQMGMPGMAPAAQMQPPSQMTAPPQMQAQAQTPQGASKPVPTVDVRTLPIAGQKTAAPVAAARRPARPPARRAPAPKPLADDDDSAPSSQGAAPKPAAAPPADTVSPDTLLQAL